MGGPTIRACFESPNCGCRWTTPTTRCARRCWRAWACQMPTCSPSASSSATTTRVARPPSCSATRSTARCATRRRCWQGMPATPMCAPRPTRRYRFVGHAPADFRAAGRPRPVVVGFGPCGIFAALILAQMGLAPDRAGARQGRARTHPRHLGPVAPPRAGAGVERAVRRRRRRHLLRRQALEPDQRSAPPDAQGAERVRQGRRAGGDPLGRQAAHRHLPARLDGREDARRDRGPRRRDPLRRSA